MMKTLGIFILCTGALHALLRCQFWFIKRGAGKPLMTTSCWSVSSRLWPLVVWIHLAPSSGGHLAPSWDTRGHEKWSLADSKMFGMSGMSGISTEAESALHCHERLEIRKGQVAKHLRGSGILWSAGRMDAMLILHRLHLQSLHLVPWFPTKISYVCLVAQVKNLLCVFLRYKTWRVLRSNPYHIISMVNIVKSFILISLPNNSPCTEELLGVLCLAGGHQQHQEFHPWSHPRWPHHLAADPRWDLILGANLLLHVQEQLIISLIFLMNMISSDILLDWT